MAGGQDPKGYYARLGISPSASADEIKAAYRKLAKQLHPDINQDTTAKARFQAVSEAYAILGDPESRNAYDALQYANANPEPREEKIDPIRCSHCGKVTAQPRSTVFFRVTSFLLLTVRTPIQGIFCSACAKKIAFQASLVSGLFGWWCFPWGPFRTIAAICGNAGGGKYSKDVEDKLICYNAIAFLTQGKLAIAYALAQQARRARDTEVGLRAAKLMDHLRALGVPASSPELKNPWSNPLLAFIQVGLLLWVPGTICGVFAYHEYSRTTTTTYGAANFSAGNQSASKPDFSRYATPAPPPPPSCSIPPFNGKVLARNVTPPKDGHVLEIRNGTNGNAIVKIRDALSGNLRVSFFVERASTASFAGLPDGVYRFQYAFGGQLSSDCRSFSHIDYAGQFPETETLMTETTRTQIITKRLSYTLYAVPGGNVRPQAIDISTFNSN
jgi:hypothetical protein